MKKLFWIIFFMVLLNLSAYASDNDTINHNIDI